MEDEQNRVCDSAKLWHCVIVTWWQGDIVTLWHCDIVTLYQSCQREAVACQTPLGDVLMNTKYRLVPIKSLRSISLSDDRQTAFVWTFLDINWQLQLSIFRKLEIISRKYILSKYQQSNRVWYLRGWTIMVEIVSGIGSNSRKLEIRLERISLQLWAFCPIDPNQNFSHRRWEVIFSTSLARLRLKADLMALKLNHNGLVANLEEEEGEAFMSSWFMEILHGWQMASLQTVGTKYVLRNMRRKLKMGKYDIIIR